MGASPRFWVSLPGRGKAVEMTAAELDERRKRGDLPAGTLIARFGTTEWVSSDAVEPLLVAAREEEGLGQDRSSLEPAPPSSAVQGADVFEPPPDFAPTIAGEEAPELEAKPLAVVEPAPEARRAPAPEPKSRTVVLVLTSALIALLLSASVFWAWFRYGYARGSVLEHVPTDCRRLEYVDFAAIDAAPFMKSLGPRRLKALTDWVEDADDEDEFRRSQDDDAKGRVSVIRTLKRFGLAPYGDVKEVAFCELHDGDETELITVVGGTFRGRDLVTAIREALLRRDRKVKDDRLQVDEVDGRPMLKLDENRSLIMVTGQVAMIGKRKVVARWFTSKSAARAYGIRDEDVLFRHWAPSKDGAAPEEERYTLGRDQLLWVRTWAPGPGDDEKAIKDRFAQAANRLRKLDGVDVLANDYDAVDVKVEGGEGRTQLSFPYKDAGKAMTAILDADRRELKQIVETLRFAQGVEVFHHAALPGVDYFELKLSPW